MKATYLTETTSVTDQKISEMTPYTSPVDGSTACPSIANTVCTAYSGLVPMSPNTTPRAPTASPTSPAPCAAGCGRGGCASDAVTSGGSPDATNSPAVGGSPSTGSFPAALAPVRSTPPVSPRVSPTAATRARRESERGRHASELGAGRAAVAAEKQIGGSRTCDPEAP